MPHFARTSVRASALSKLYQVYLGQPALVIERRVQGCLTEPTRPTFQGANGQPGKALQPALGAHGDVAMTSTDPHRGAGELDICEVAAICSFPAGNSLGS
jgi:hypothetical protein